MKESRVEQVLVDAAKAVKGICWKWVSTRRGVPDRIVLLPIPEEHQEIVAKYVRFVETKAFGKEGSEQQKYIHDRLREIGYKVDIVSTTDRAKKFIQEVGR